MKRMCYIVLLSISKSGGTERATVNLANMLREMGSPVSIISIYTHDGSQPYYSLTTDVHLHHLNMKEVPLNFFSKIFWFYKLYKTLDKLVCEEAVIIGTGHDINVLISFLRNNHRRIVGCEHIQKEMLPILSRFIMRMTYPFLHSLVLLSPSARKKYMNYNRNTFVIPNTLPFETSKVKNAFEKKIIMVGRIDMNKGYVRAIPIFIYLKDNYPEWEVNIYGDGEEKNNIDNLIELNGLTNVNIHMPVRNIEEKYSESSIMLMTSYSEAMPMVILEANSYGLPVVAYECEGTRELIKDGDTGFLIKSDDTKSFCDCLSQLIEDAEKMKLFSDASFEYAKHFSKHNVSSLWQKMLESIS